MEVEKAWVVCGRFKKKLKDLGELSKFRYEGCPEKCKNNTLNLWRVGKIRLSPINRGYEKCPKCGKSKFKVHSRFFCGFE